jgi:hypothetical protein
LALSQLIPVRQLNASSLKKARSARPMWLR